MIRRANLNDLSEIMPLFDNARLFMRRMGNMDQWTNGYPSEHVIRSDIENGNFYVEDSDGSITGAFAFILGDDPTYSVIEGMWLNALPYGTVHRIASDGRTKGFSDRCFDFCRNIVDNIRVDTHRDNATMQKALLRNGFTYCGIIHLADGSPRVAFQRCDSE